MSDFMDLDELGLGDEIDTAMWPLLIELFSRLPRDERRDPPDPEPLI